ncbi:TrmH family RNA methyltransferase [Sphingomonas sp. BAUL-RG-20F-R05-02]|uniref:TrmH family RNA methyltransferase n=1 Tax=Sphingomonas sp. BAUL-RG-20F-R05-02 TaxID=2914830 RepID=UPI001F5978CD|nr:TrmH family RNA methyltransferase [Sphingomonas sp. BAUL-RG-20F-R05-02]
MSFWVYILRCADGSYYTGHTDDLERRVGQHQSGEFEGYTLSRLPVELLWSQDFPSRVEALEAEQRVKPWARARQEALTAADLEALRIVAMPQSQHDVPRPDPERTAHGDAGPRPQPVRAERERGTATVRSETQAPAQTPPPVIVLVRPQLGENIGKAARAMLNFGLVEMRLVAPRDGWPNPAAGPAASGADSVLEHAQVFDTLAEAIADCPNVYATTVRKRGVTKPVVTPEVAARAIHAGPGRTAILFGPERSGLETDDVAVAREIITVPINPEFGSLNLAQAVILVAYEWSKGVALSQPPEVDLPEPAPQEELDGMIAQLDGMLEEANFFFPPDRSPVTRRTLRTLLTKPAWSSQEVRTLRGVLSALAGAKRKKTLD